MACLQRGLPTLTFWFSCLTPAGCWVSASQDGKLIIWDSYTTNKVGAAPPAALGQHCSAQPALTPGTTPTPGPRHPAALLLGHDPAYAPPQGTSAAWAGTSTTSAPFTASDP